MQLDDTLSAMIVCGAFAIIGYRTSFVDYLMQVIQRIVDFLNDDQMPRPPLAPAAPSQ